MLLDLLGRRWALRLIWELREQPRRFRELQDSIGASPTVVNTRLAEVKGNKLYFDVECREGDKLLGSGVHKRAIVPATF